MESNNRLTHCRPGHLDRHQSNINQKRALAVQEASDILGCTGQSIASRIREVILFLSTQHWLYHTWK